MNDLPEGSNIVMQLQQTRDGSQTWFARLQIGWHARVTVEAYGGSAQQVLEHLERQWRFQRQAEAQQ